MDRARALIERTADHLARASGATAETEFLQPVPAVHNSPACVDAALPTLRRVAGDAMVYESPPVLAYDDVAEFVNRYGGLYVMLGAQDTRFTADGTGPAGRDLQRRPRSTTPAPPAPRRSRCRRGRTS